MILMAAPENLERRWAGVQQGQSSQLMTVGRLGSESRYLVVPKEEGMLGNAARDKSMGADMRIHHKIPAEAEDTSQT